MVPPMERRNFSQIYSKVQLQELQAAVPDFNFDTFLGGLMPRELNVTEEVVIYALPYFKKLTQLVNDSNPRYAVTHQANYWPLTTASFLQDCGELHSLALHPPSGQQLGQEVPAHSA